MATNGKTSEEPKPDSAKTANDAINATVKIPEWITLQYFEDVVKSDVKEFKKIIKFSPEPGTGVGENYASVMLRIKIDVELNDGSTKNLSYMLKIDNASEQGAMLTNMMKLFERENELYDVIIPKFQDLYRKKGKHVEFGPKTFKFTKNPGVNTLLLEDLKSRNFKNTNRLDGLDMEHIKCVLRKLAEFHAASACYYETNGPYSDILLDGVFNESNREFFKTINDGMVTLYKKCAKKWKNCEAYADKLPSNGEKFVDKMMDAIRVDSSGFNVLNHGDCWSNNIMFQYNSADDITEAFLIDYQVCKYGSPAQDLYYLLISSVRQDIKLKYFDYFIRYYHLHLVENLKLLEYPKKMPLLLDLHIDLLKRGFWGTSTASGVLAAVLLPPRDDANMDNFLSTDDAGTGFKEALYLNPLYAKAMEEILPWFDNRGILDLFLVD